MIHRILPRLILLFALIVHITSLHAQSVITSPGDPALAGAGVIDFSSPAPGTYPSLNISFVNFAGPSGVTIESLYAGNYNSTGQYLNNANAASPKITITFGVSLAAFGFNYGASDDPWTLSAFDAGNNLILSTVVAPIGGSASGEFIGIASPSANIAYATFKDDGGIWFPDWVLIDNLAFTEVVNTPEPSALALAGFGAMLLGLARSRRTPGRPSPVG